MNSKRQVSDLWRQKSTNNKSEKATMKSLVLDWNLGHPYEPIVLKFIYIYRWILQEYIQICTHVLVYSTKR